MCCSLSAARSFQAESSCSTLDVRAPGSHLATFRPISFSRLMTERGPGSSLILSTSGCSTESASTNNPIYQRLQTNCKHPALLPLLLLITVKLCWVGKQLQVHFLSPCLISGVFLSFLSVNEFEMLLWRQVTCWEIRGIREY